MKYVIESYAAAKEALGAMCAELARLGETFSFEGELVAMELLSNVLQHGGGRAYFSYTIDGAALTIRVRGENGFKPPEESTLADTMSESGRGLYLVDALSEGRSYSERDGISVTLRYKK